MSALSRESGYRVGVDRWVFVRVRWEFAPPAAVVDRPPFEHIDNALKAGVRT